MAAEPRVLFRGVHFLSKSLHALLSTPPYYSLVVNLDASSRLAIDFADYKLDRFTYCAFSIELTKPLMFEPSKKAFSGDVELVCPQRQTPQPQRIRLGRFVINTEAFISDWGEFYVTIEESDLVIHFALDPNEDLSPLRSQIWDAYLATGISPFSIAAAAAESQVHQRIRKLRDYQDWMYRHNIRLNLRTNDVDILSLNEWRRVLFREMRLVPKEPTRPLRYHHTCPDIFDVYAFPHPVGGIPTNAFAYKFTTADRQSEFVVTTPLPDGKVFSHRTYSLLSYLKNALVLTLCGTAVFGVDYLRKGPLGRFEERQLFPDPQFSPRVIHETTKAWFVDPAHDRPVSSAATVLQWAVLKGDCSFVAWLCNAGVDPFVETAFGASAMMIAVCNNQEKCFDILMAYQSWLIARRILAGQRPNADALPCYPFSEARFCSPNGIGHAVIFVALVEGDSFFTPKQLEDAELTALKLLRTLALLGFRPRIELRASKKSDWTKLDLFKKEMHERSDCFALFILSHGDENWLSFSQKEFLEIEREILQPLRRVDTLRGKPKIICFASCRGTGVDIGYGMNPSNVVQALPTASREVAYREICVANQSALSDFFIAYAATPGFLSFGSAYLALVERSLYVNVGRIESLSDIFAAIPSSYYEGHGTYSTSYFVNHLRAKFCFPAASQSQSL